LTHKTKAVGHRGSWFAEVDGELLPCVHKHWWRGRSYHDPNARPGDVKWNELIEAIRDKGRVVLTDDRVSDDETAFERSGYIAVYEVANLQVEGSHLKFDFVRRIANLS
jgi:hypothetical protein